MTSHPAGIVEGRLSRVVLDGEIPSTLPPALEADRAQAVADLAAENHFVPLTLKPGARRMVRSCCTLPCRTAGWCSTSAAAMARGWR